MGQDDDRAGGSLDDIPTGTVAFFFTDVEGSTRMWENEPEKMRSALRRHDEIVRSAIESNKGYVFSLAGDQFVASFHDIHAALTGAQDAQRQIAAETWPTESAVRIRIGIHVGVAEERDNDYFGQVLNRTARIVSAAHGGQTILSGAAAALARGVELDDLGEHRLKDLAEAEHLWQAGRDSFPPLRTLHAGRHNFRVERTPLVGRSDDIIAISKTVLEHRLVTLLGIGGTGKTRLASAVAAEVGDRFEDGTWFVDLVPTSDQNGVAEAIASAVGLQLTGHDLLGALADQLVRRDLLLVMDNCEHITDDVADVVDFLLERTQRLHVLATSRETLDLPDEHQVRVTPLPVRDSASSPAVRLFFDAATRVGAEVDSADIDVVISICERLDGLPLAIELAAAQLRQLSPAELADRLDRRFELLDRGRSNRRRRRQTSLLDVLTDSWEMLDRDEQQLLAYLAAFPASFDLADVEGLANTTSGISRSLGGLSDRGLVATAGDGRSRLLETVKLFVRERWADLPSSTHADAHTAWVLAHLDAHGNDNQHQSISLAGWAVRHYDDHRAVEDRLASAGRFGELAELLRSLRWAYSREMPQRASALIDRIEHYLATFELTDWQSASLHLVACRAGRAARHGEWIRRGGEEAVDKFRPSGPTPELAAALITSTFNLIVHDPIEAFRRLDEAYDIALGLGADALGADTLVAATQGYRANYLAMELKFAEVRDVLAELELRPNADRIDNILVMVLEATLVINLLEDPPIARSAIKRCVDVTAEHGLDHDWFMLLHLAIGVAVTGDVRATVEAIDEVTARLDKSGLNGLPDLLLPYLALAHALGDDDRCRRWLTAIRQGTGHLGTGITIATYRMHRTAVGLDSTNPLDGATIDDLHTEAIAWANTLIDDPFR